MNRESKLMREIQIKASKQGSRLFRNNIGFCTCRGRKIRYGVGGKGGSDLIGWTKEGKFLAIEVKIDSPTTKEQAAFLNAVIKSGGVGFIAYSTDDIEIALSTNK